MPPHIYVGRFDPKFLGVTIRAADRGAAHGFRLLDEGARAPAEILAVLDDEAAVSDLSRLSVVPHETRHFHDALLLPFGAVATRSRLHTAVNGFTVAMLLRRHSGPADALAVPLQQWLTMPAAERAGYLAAVSGPDGPKWTVPELPVVGADDDLSGYGPGSHEFDDDGTALVVGCRAALADYRLLETLWRSPHLPGEEPVLPAVDAWEGSGLLCQLAAIDARADAAAMSRFQGWMVEHGPQTYRRALRTLSWVVTELGWPSTLRAALALATWSQLGPYATEAVASSPRDRLGRLVLAARAGARWSADSAFLDLVAAWDEVVGTDSVAGLHAAADGFDGFVRRTLAETSPVGMAALVSPELLTGLAAARRAMLAAFLADPDTYVDPVGYVAAAADYPRPAVAVQFPTGADEVTSWEDATPPGWEPAIGTETNRGLLALAELADAVFLPGEKSLQPSGRAYIRQYLGLTALRVIR